MRITKFFKEFFSNTLSNLREIKFIQDLLNGSFNNTFLR